jgi:hypothetical protein
MADPRGTLYAFAHPSPTACRSAHDLFESPCFPRRARRRATLALTAAAATVSAQTKWDLPAAYPATNFHTENLVQFANDVEKASAAS